MDPKAAHQQALQGDHEATLGLIEWLERGGALPVPTNDPKFSRAAFIRALRKMAANNKGL